MEKAAQKSIHKKVLISILAFISTFSLTWYPGSPLFLHGNSFSSLILFFILYKLYLNTSKHLEKRRFYVCIVGGLLLGTCTALGAMMTGGGGFTHVFLMLPGFTVFFFMILNYIFVWLDNHSKKPATELSSSKFQKIIRFLFGTKKHSFLCLFLLTIVLWSPYYILSFPGLVSLDVFIQIETWFGLVDFTAHHPPLHTAFIGASMQLGEWLFGTYSAGVAIASGLQLLLTSLLITFVLRTMSRLNIHKSFCVAALLFYGVLPLMGFYVVTLWKDIWLANFTLLFVLCIIELSQKKAEFFKSPKQITLFIFSILGLLISKNNGFYIAFLTLAVLLITQKGLRIRLGAFLLATVLANSLITGPLYSAMGVSSGDMREALSLPLMQISRVVSQDPNSISDDDKALIDTVLPYDELPERYSNIISDGVKSVFDTETFLADPMKYAQLWLRIGLGSPREYILATLHQTLGYWYPDVQHWIFAYNTYPAELAETTTAVAEMDTMTEKYTQPLSQLHDDVLLTLAYARNVPVLSMFYSIGFYFWILLTAFLYILYKKSYYKLLGVVPAFVVWLTCLASPVYAEFRYAWPAIICVPLILGWCCFNNNVNPMCTTLDTSAVKDENIPAKK